MQLTANFSLREFERSTLAATNGIDNSIPEVLLPNVKRVAELMQKIRAVLGSKVITVWSGYRCRKVNALARGSTTSAHMVALACDFIVQGMTPHEVALALRPLVKELGIDQLILEFGQWTHVGLTTGAPRNQVFSYVTRNGETVKVDGLTTR